MKLKREVFLKYQKPRLKTLKSLMQNLIKVIMSLIKIWAVQLFTYTDSILNISLIEKNSITRSLLIRILKEKEDIYITMDMEESNHIKKILYI